LEKGESMLKETSESKFIFLGNYKCLDFINTQIMERGHLVDLIQDFSGLVEWLVKAQVLNLAEARETIGRWNSKLEGKRTFERALAFRAVLQKMVERIVGGRPVQQSTIDEINRLLGYRIGYTQLTRVRGRFETRFHGKFDEAIHLMVPIAESASDLLCYGDLSLIKKCENPDCVLYFYDVSKNHSRRWCSMNVCGNRMKVAAHYRRHRHTKGR
jgi:predicted RNA-binding Zn ribbon-like protein